MKKLVSAVLLLMLVCTCVVYQTSAIAQTSAVYNENYEVSDVLARYLQMRLSELGYYHGEPNTVYDEQMKSAVAAFQKDVGLPSDSSVDLALIKALFINTGAAMVNTTTPAPTPKPSPTPVPSLPKTVPAYSAIINRGSTGKSVEYIQIQLWMLDYYRGDVTGAFDDATRDAVIAFQRNNRLDADGVVGKQSWNKLFFDESVYSASETPPPTPTPFPKSMYGKYDYKEAARYPEKHIGDKVVISGTVIQMMGSRKEGYNLRVAVNGSYSNVVYVFVSSDPGFGILEDDKIRIYATCRDQYTYTSTMSKVVTIPSVRADLVELR